MYIVTFFATVTIFASVKLMRILENDKIFALVLQLSFEKILWAKYRLDLPYCQG